MPNELCFAIYYKVPDRAFERAAATWVAQECGNRPVLTEVVASEADFKRAWDAVALRARSANARVVLGQVFSHSSKGATRPGWSSSPAGGTTAPSPRPRFSRCRCCRGRPAAG